MAAQLSIALVEDNDDLRESLAEALKREGHEVLALDCAEALPESPCIGSLDLFIIDINLPGETGFVLADRLRRTHSEVGIIIMTARTELSDKKTGYAMGADIYLTKPIEVDELLSAIQALSRRLKFHMVAPYGLHINKRTMLVSSSEGTSVALSMHELNLLVAFALAPGYRLEKWQIIELLGKAETADPIKTTVLAIVRLRKKLKFLGLEKPTIKMIRSWGYQLCIPIQID